MAEDSVGQRILVRNFLQNWGAKVSLATNGKEAVEQCFDEAGSPAIDVVLMDGMMPVMDGLEACMAIREREKLNKAGKSDCEREFHAPIIVIGVSGMTEDEDKARFIECGMDDVVTKPFNRNVLHDTIMKLLESKMSPGLERSFSTHRVASSSADTINARYKLGTVRGANKTFDLQDVLSSNQPLVINGTAAPPPAGQSNLCVRRISSPQPSPPVLASPAGLVSVDELYASAQGRNGRKLQHPGDNSAQVSKKDVTSKWRGEVAHTNDSDERGGGSSEGGYSGQSSSRDITIESECSIERKKSEDDAVAVVSDDGSGPVQRSLSQDSCGSASVKILVVDDQEANLMLMTRMLKKKDFYFEVARDGLQACTCASNEVFDCILMDCNMPVMDGWEATERIRSSHGLNDMTPIIAVTANAMAGDRERCLEKGMSDYMSKPVNKSAMFATIEKWLGKKHCQARERLRHPHPVLEATLELESSST